MERFDVSVVDERGYPIEIGFLGDIRIFDTRKVAVHELTARLREVRPRDGLLDESKKLVAGNTPIDQVPCCLTFFQTPPASLQASAIFSARSKSSRSRPHPCSKTYFVTSTTISTAVGVS